MKLKHVLIAVLLIVVVGALFPVRPRGDIGDRRTRERNDVMNLTAALRQYRVEYGHYPPGEQAEIMRALCGQNPRAIVFFETRQNAFNKGGEFIDRWGTPYKIELSDERIPHVSSAGRNKMFEGERSDDILSWE